MHITALIRQLRYYITSSSFGLYFGNRPKGLSLCIIVWFIFFTKLLLYIFTHFFVLHAINSHHLSNKVNSAGGGGEAGKDNGEGGGDSENSDDE